MRRFIWSLIVLVTLTGPFSVSIFAAPTDEKALFPVPEQLEGHVTFWKSVFAEHDVDRIVVHDMDYPGLVYEVFDLPGTMEAAYTKKQEKFVEKRRESLEDRLKILEHAVDAGKKLTTTQKELALKISTTLGAERISGAHKRVRTQRGLRSKFMHGIELGNRYSVVFLDILKDSGVPEDLIYLPHVESSYQPSVRSSAGAAGIWQFTRYTGKQYLKINSAIDERFDPVAATQGAAEYLADAYRRLGSWPLAITSYNHGVNGMGRAQKQFGDDLGTIVYNYHSRYFGFASKNFYAEFLAAREVAGNSDQYFPEGLSLATPLSEEGLTLKRSTRAVHLAREYGVSMNDLAGLNPAWSRRTVYNSLSVPAGTTVWLPRGTLETHAGGQVPEVDLTPPGPPPDSFHVVRRGENLSVIARQYSMKTSTLRKMNGMAPRDSRIYAGEKLRIYLPATTHETREHRVLRGETLSGIAQLYKVHLDDLLLLNQLTLRSVIHPGQEIKIR
jgi:membrane-bound lytic murein transglycosylase D